MAAWATGAINEVKDPEAFPKYQQLAGPTLEQYGGKVLAYGTKVEVADGNWSPMGAIIIEFESITKTREWHNSPEYHPLVSRRTGSTDSGLILVEGD